MTQNSNTQAITVSHLKKTYGKLTAVEEVSFEVNEGEIFGMLGPNGAGKTTTVECITGLRHPDAGTISVLGLDPQADRDALHPVVGVQLQSSTFPDKLKVSEILDMYRSFYRNPANPEELARALGFGEKLGSYYKTLSGGQKQVSPLKLLRCRAPGRWLETFSPTANPFKPFNGSLLEVLTISAQIEE